MPAGPNPYLKTKVLTASPEELRLMLFDGGIKFCRQGIAAIERKDFEASFNNLSRAQKIVMELSNSLDHKVEPQLTEKMAALYTYVYKLLVDANTQRETEPIDEAIKLLSYERETWAMLIAKVKAEAPQASARSAQAASANPYANHAVAGVYSQSA